MENEGTNPSQSVSVKNIGDIGDICDMGDIHIGIIPDGNRRWCRKNNVRVFDLIEMMRNMAYKQVDAVLKEYKDKREISYPNLLCIKHVSIYILSKDNLTKRNDDTLNMIRHALQIIADDLKHVQQNTDTAISKTIKQLLGEVKVQFVGELDLLPQDIFELCKYIESQTTGEKYVITAGIAYDPIEDVEKIVTGNRGEQSPIDVVIRTGGEQRSSGFFPLQVLYSEWIYLQKLWPDFSVKDLDECISIFKQRNRRFGK